MDKWSFQSSFLWQNDYPECGNLTQSPINIDTTLLQECNTLCDFDTIYKTSKCFINYKNNNISIKYSGGSYIKYKDIFYELKEITIHTPSLHSIDNQKYDLEMCLIHKLSGNSKDSNGVMLCILFEAGPNFGSAEQFINQIINDIPVEEINYDKEVMVSKDWSANMLLPKNKSFYTYNGSLPFPPCTELYDVFVFEQINKLGKTNLDIFKQFLGKNIRKVQPLNNRIVFYKSKTKQIKKETNIIKSDNKYLQCRKIEAPPTKPVTTEKVEEKKEDPGLDNSIKQKIKQYGIALSVFLLFGLAYLTITFMFKYYIGQRILRALAGSQVVTVDVIKDWRFGIKNTREDSKKQSMQGVPQAQGGEEQGGEVEQ